MHNCPCCDVRPGALHVPYCDIEQCHVCGLLVQSCGHDQPSAENSIPWSGEYPNVAACHELGLYAKMEPGEGWVPCGKDDPGAQPDLNTLYATCVWDREAKKWVKP